MTENKEVYYEEIDIQGDPEDEGKIKAYPYRMTVQRYKQLSLIILKTGHKSIKELIDQALESYLDKIGAQPRPIKRPRSEDEEEALKGLLEFARQHHNTEAVEGLFHIRKGTLSRLLRGE